ncbi:MAG: hypothetical protein KC731_38625, partial [Myxococcales bacterium]|nr:hypothetical protein [Myxococcales bacterium]
CGAFIGYQDQYIFCGQACGGQNECGAWCENMMGGDPTDTAMYPGCNPCVDDPAWGNPPSGSDFETDVMGFQQACGGDPACLAFAQNLNTCPQQ